ncbi:hypothetical protein Sango_3010800 [Sesamum angolense]|uniref:Endonuclease/exonuclease/phosphatase domain-containing protein n=1 Tax=Sesamum angolense TaxID=2727404 RepID=A0AAE1T4E7_9LAMI|nr:hypothetical protein Sango_3010800 [Sesamum angolense]
MPNGRENGASPTRPYQDSLEHLLQPGKSPMFIDIWTSSPPSLAFPTLPAISSSPTASVQHAVTRPPSQTWNKVELPQHHAATATFSTRRSARPATTSTPATTAAPVKPLPEFFIGNVPFHPQLPSKIDEDKIAEAFHNSSKNPQLHSTFGAKWGEGLSTVASGIGRPLYPDAITRTCTRLDFARVCVMLHVSSKLPKHVVIMMPNELEFEGMPSFQTNEARGLLYIRKSMPPKQAAPEMKISEQAQVDPSQKEIQPQMEVDRGSEEMTENGRDKAPQTFPHVKYSDLECWGLNRRDHQVAVRDLVSEFRLHFIALLETRVLQSNATRIQSGVLSRWRWFVDYAGPGNRIWIAWNDEFIDVDILNVDSQYVHCRVHFHELHEIILITVVYGANDVSTRRDLWQGLIDLAVTVGSEPWMVGGDFNAVLDMSEVSGASGDIRVAMNEFNDCILQTGLLLFLCKVNVSLGITVA